MSIVIGVGGFFIILSNILHMIVWKIWILEWLVLKNKRLLFLYFLIEFAYLKQ